MKKIFTLFATLIFATAMQAQITRGAVPGEIYLSTDWYMDDYGQIHYAILHSTDHGAHISLKYENTETPPPDEMRVGKVLGDATPGALYNYGSNELWVSFDYGANWEYREDFPGYTSFFSGVNQGLIFKGNNQGFFKSSDYAATFELLPITVTCPFTEVGFSEPEFLGIYGEPGLYYKFVHTLDYGQTYIEYTIDSTVAFWAPSGQFPKISRGTEPGEVYLVSWTPELHYRIFHSADTGYSWTQKYESGYINVYYWRVAYTAGREPGSFYVVRSRINEAGDHVWLYIDYSNDYGASFTTYFHDLDSTITGIHDPDKPQMELSNDPNPFSNRTTFYLPEPENPDKAVIHIYNINGTPVRQIPCNGKTSLVWNATDSHGNLVKAGIYLYNITYGSDASKFNKLLILN